MSAPGRDGFADARATSDPPDAETLLRSWLGRAIATFECRSKVNLGVSATTATATATATAGTIPKWRVAFAG